MVKILKSPKGHKKQLLFICNWLYLHLRLKRKVVISIKKRQRYDWGQYTWLNGKNDYEYETCGPCHFIVINKDAFLYNNKTIDGGEDIISVARIVAHEMFHASQEERKIALSEHNATKAEVKIWNKMRKELLATLDFVG
jgi:hypothetical protein